VKWIVQCFLDLVWRDELTPPPPTHTHTHTHTPRNFRLGGGGARSKKLHSWPKVGGWASFSKLRHYMNCWESMKNLKTLIDDNALIYCDWGRCWRNWDKIWWVIGPFQRVMKWRIGSRKRARNIPFWTVKNTNFLKNVSHFWTWFSHRSDQKSKIDEQNLKKTHSRSWGSIFRVRTLLTTEN
jgi:hypothetical protein